MILTATVFVLLFATLNVIQSLLGFAMNGPIGVFIAWVNFIHEVDLVAQVVSTFLLYPKPLQLLFETVLSREGYDDVVLRGKLFRVVDVSIMKRFKRWLLDLPNNLIIYPMTSINFAITVILTFVPIVGPILLVFINAPQRGFGFHNRYYELKGIDTRQKNAFYASRRFHYIGFGIVTGILQNIPFVSTLFQFTSVTGAALLAAEFESQFAQQRAGKITLKPGQRPGSFIMGPNYYEGQIPRHPAPVIVPLAVPVVRTFGR